MLHVAKYDNTKIAPIEAAAANNSKQGQKSQVRIRILTQPYEKYYLLHCQFHPLGDLIFDMQLVKYRLELKLASQKC